MYREEKVKMLEKLTLKPSTISNAYNMLQDMRHLLILDLRSEGEFQNEGHIRKSIKTDL